MKTVIQKEDVLEKAIRTRYYFDIQGILDAMQKDGLIKPDGTLYSLFLRSRAEGKDCYQTVCDILEYAEDIYQLKSPLNAQISDAAQRSGIPVSDSISGKEMGR